MHQNFFLSLKTRDHTWLEAFLINKCGNKEPIEITEENRMKETSLLILENKLCFLIVKPQILITFCQRKQK